MESPFFQHPLALVETDDIGKGTRIWAWAHVMKGARIGSDCNVGEHCFVEQGVVPRAQAVRAEIAPHAVAQRTRLAHVERLTRGVGPQIDSGLLRQSPQLILEVMNGHGLP